MEREGRKEGRKDVEALSPSFPFFHSLSLSQPALFFFSGRLLSTPMQLPSSASLPFPSRFPAFSRPSPWMDRGHTSLLCSAACEASLFRRLRPPFPGRTRPRFLRGAFKRPFRAWSTVEKRLRTLETKKSAGNESFLLLRVRMTCSKGAACLLCLDLIAGDVTKQAAM